MKLNRIRMQEIIKREMYSGLFYTGFFSGIILSCLIWKKEKIIIESTILYLLAELGKQIPSTEYFKTEIVYTRGPIWILWILSGFTIFGIPLSIAFVLWNGWYIGVIFTTAIIHFGLSGGFLAFFLLTPHYFLYLPAILGQAKQNQKFSEAHGRRKWPELKEIKIHIIKTVFYTALIAAGMYLEGYVNPVLLQFWIEKSKIL